MEKDANKYFLSAFEYYSKHYKKKVKTQQLVKTSR